MEVVLLKAFELLQETGQRNLEISAEILKILSKDSEAEGPKLSDILESIDNRLAAIERKLEIKGSSKHNSSKDQPAQPHSTELSKQLDETNDMNLAESCHDDADAIAAATAVTITDIYDDEGDEEDA